MQVEPPMVTEKFISVENSLPLKNDFAFKEMLLPAVTLLFVFVEFGSISCIVKLIATAVAVRFMFFVSVNDKLIIEIFVE